MAAARTAVRITIRTRKLASPIGALADVGSDGQPAQHARHADHGRQRQQAAERRAQQHEQDDAADGIGADPLRGQGQPEQHPDRRDGQGDGPSAAPQAQVDRHEQHVGGDDEEGHVRVVHGDARLGEEHAVDQHQAGRQEGHRPAAEQHAHEQVEAAQQERAGDDAHDPPRVGVVPDVDDGQLAGRVHGQELLAVLRRALGLRVEGHRQRRERQARVGEDGVAVRLHDVDGVAAAVGRAAQGRG